MIKRNLAAGLPFSIRLKIGEEPLRFQDMVRGPVEFQAEAVSDPILVRSGTEAEPGIPVYNFVVTVDDALMKITHVIRGDDHISNTPKQVAIYEAFGWEVPMFAHLSTILGGGPRTTVEAARRNFDRYVSRNGLPAGSVGELSCPAGMGRRRWQDRNLHSARTRRRNSRWNA